MGQGQDKMSPEHFAMPKCRESKNSGDMSEGHRKRLARSNCLNLNILNIVTNNGINGLEFIIKIEKTSITNNNRECQMEPRVFTHVQFESVPLKL